MKDHPNHPHELVSLILDIISWGMFLAVWITLAIEISSDTSYCNPRGYGHLHTRGCNTLYSAFALAIVVWLLYTLSGWGSWIRFVNRKRGQIGRIAGLMS